MNSLIQLILVHFRNFFREPAILFWALVFPILMAWVLGIAFSSKGESQSTVYILNEDSRLTGTRVFGQGTGNSFRIHFELKDQEQAVRAIKRGEISMYAKTKGDSVIYYFDPKNAEAQILHLVIERELNNRAVAESRIQPLDTRGTRYIDFLIPGLIALGIMNSCLWGISWTLIETRMKKLMRRMVATPMKRSFFLASHVVTRIILGGVETILLLLFAWLYFDITITGSFIGFITIFLSGIIAFSGIGILTASRTDKSEIGGGIINAVTLSMTILSGIFFNYHSFPDWAISFIQVLPLTLLADGIRAIFIEAASFTEVLIPSAILLAIGTTCFIVGLKIFKWY
jgi:ABC-2 type transport system permease protein